MCLLWDSKIQMPSIWVFDVTIWLSFLSLLQDSKIIMPSICHSHMIVCFDSLDYPFFFVLFRWLILVTKHRGRTDEGTARLTNHWIWTNMVPDNLAITWVIMPAVNGVILLNVKQNCATATANSLKAPGMILAYTVEPC